MPFTIRHKRLPLRLLDGYFAQGSPPKMLYTHFDSSMHAMRPTSLNLLDLIIPIDIY